MSIVSVARRFIGDPTKSGEVVPYVGNMSQTAGHKTVVYDEGIEQGTKVIKVSAGPIGEPDRIFNYDVVATRGADIGYAEFGVPLTWISRSGYSPAIPQDVLGVAPGMQWIKRFSGGVVTTCGPENVGGPCEDWPGKGETGNKVQLGLHGSYNNTKAIVRPKSEWTEGRWYETTIEAEVLVPTVFGPEYLVNRKIKSAMGVPLIEINDRVTNVGSDEVPHQWLYHCQGGWKLLRPGTRIAYAAERVTPRKGRDIISPEYFAEGNPFRVAPEPVHRGPEEAFAYVSPIPVDGTTATAGFVDEESNLALAFFWDLKQLPGLGNWVHWAKGEYTSGLEPMAKGTRVEGRNKDRADGILQFLQPGESREYNLVVAVIHTPDQIKAYLEQLRELDSAA